MTKLVCGKCYRSAMSVCPWRRYLKKKNGFHLRKSPPQSETSVYWGARQFWFFHLFLCQKERNSLDNLFFIIPSVFFPLFASSWAHFMCSFYLFIKLRLFLRSYSGPVTRKVFFQEAKFRQHVRLSNLPLFFNNDESIDHVETKYSHGIASWQGCGQNLLFI